MKKDFSAFVAELIGTFALVFVGGGAAITASSLLLASPIEVAFAHGLVLMSMIYALGHVSGGHFNPAVTFGVWFGKKMETPKAVGYVVSQLVGASLAALFLSFVFINGVHPLAPAVPALADGISLFRGIFIEAVLTFFLVLTVFGTAIDKRAPAPVYGLAIGLVLAFDILVGGPLTGGAMNPARAFGPALLTGLWENQLVYWVGPLLGALVAAGLYSQFFLKGEVK
ncbi:MAG: aquaporin [Candidatus Diapherotrites archaeon]|nr:aquaporin [Candidatus Diapherotrites archaeon]